MVKDVGRLSKHFNGSIDKFTQFFLWGMISVFINTLSTVATTTKKSGHITKTR